MQGSSLTLFQPAWVSAGHVRYRITEVSVTTLRSTDQYLRITCFAFVVVGREQPLASSQRPAAQHIHGAGRRPC
jgi:hypothetical protein